jgi:DMSO/TMAO reductase YedYZ heme-binding membrane subunit
VTLLAVSGGNGRALWYLTRGTGTVTLILLTVSIALGIVDQRRWRSERWPRFVLDALHRNVSLVALALLAVHVLTAWLDSYAPISLVDAVVPFHSSYRPVWLGLGALALDLMVAVIVTSLVRQRIGHQTWRAVHWLAYASWPVALVHGLGTGTDTPASWMLALSAGCVLAVLVACAVRAGQGWPTQRGVRTSAFAALAIGPLALALWLPRGPLGRAWARRAGTPASLLAFASGGRGAVAATSTTAASSTPAVDTLSAPFTAGFSGPLTQSTAPDGEAIIDLDVTLSGAGDRRLAIRIQGPPAAGGGVTMSSSRVTLGTGASPDRYQGAVVALQGNEIRAAVRSTDGHALALTLTYSIDQAAGQISGTVSAQGGAG